MAWKKYFKDPNLSPAQMSEILETTSLHLGSTGKNNTYGAGRVDAFDSVEEVFEFLCKYFADLKPNLFNENGKVHNFINVYLNDDDIRYADGMNSKVQDGDCIQIVPSVAGG